MKSFSMHSFLMCLFIISHVPSRAQVPHPTLRKLAGDRVFIGGAVNWNYLVGSSAVKPPMNDSETETYKEILAKDFNIATGENALKMRQIQPKRNFFNFSMGDDLVAFADSNNITFRAHNLVWVSHNPQWIVDLAPSLDPKGIDEIMQTHISRTASHYRGKIYSWDVVNEALVDVPKVHKCHNWTCSLKDSANTGLAVNWTKAGTPELTYIEKAFRYAHAADPHAKLFYNDYNIHTEDDKMTYVEMMMSDLVAKGVPIHGIGIQTHIQNAKDLKKWNETAFINVLNRFAAIGLEIHITELNIPIDDPIYAGQTDSQKEKTLADLYSRVLSICLNNSHCKSFETWGFVDRHNSYVKYGNLLRTPGAFYYDNDYKPKPVRAAVAKVLQ